jgi:leucyl aminopeptidase
MDVQIVKSDIKRKSADLLILPYWSEKKKPVALSSSVKLDKKLLSLLEADFKGATAEMNVSYMIGEEEKRVVLLGLGEKKEASLSSFRSAFASLGEFCKKKKISSLNIALSSDLQKDQVVAIVDALCMSSYSFDEAKRETVKDNPTVLLEHVYLIGAEKKYQTAVNEHLLLMQSVNLTRILVNRNADAAKAQDLVQIAKEMGQKHKNISCQILGKKELEKEKMGLILAVNQGARQDPALIILSYKGDPKSSDVTAFVGKGVTYDTGGLNLKPTGSMETMRVDMAGAAAVLGALQAAATLGIKKNIIGVIPSVENAIGSGSYKPGDVYIGHSGKSVEITNTDAEGRLILADALSYLQKNYKPSRIIDLATLTGGIVVAIGEEATGLFCNEPKLTKALQVAADKTGEKVWEMPLYPEYAKALKSTIADIKNSPSGRKASPCMGAMFLAEFVDKKIPWAHLDIAGTAYLSESNPYYPGFATGVGVKLLLSLLEDL